MLLPSCFCIQYRYYSGEVNLYRHDKYFLLLPLRYMYGTIEILQEYTLHLYQNQESCPCSSLVVTPLRSPPPHIPKPPVAKSLLFAVLSTPTLLLLRFCKNETLFRVWPEVNYRRNNSIKINRFLDCI